MRLHRDERGQTLILVALSLPFMLGFIGMATDVGALFKDKRTIQTAADAAAVAGALNYNRGYTAWKVAGQNAAKANGFQDGSNGATVVMPQVPAWPSSNYKGTPGYVEATVSKTESTIFLTLFGYPTVTVTARAVATSQGSGTGCIYTTGATGTTFTLTTNALDAHTCGVVVESNSANAMVASGSGNFASIGVVGGVDGSGATPAPITGIAPDSDPLNYLPQFTFNNTPARRRRPATYRVDCASGYDCSDSPIPPGSNCATTGAGVYNVAPGTTLTPGCYVGLTFPASGNVTLDPGFYLVDGDLTFGAGNVTGSGVTLYYDGTLSMGTGIYTLSPPNDTSQFFNGVLFAESVSDTDNILFNANPNANSVMNGIIYAPGTALIFPTFPTAIFAPSFVAQSLTLGGNGLTLTNYGSLPGVQSPLTSVALVE